MSDSVQQIKDRLSIVDVVSSYVELHQAGKHFKGKSPFTNEKTPSFYVSPDKGMYYCFSSSQGGDMFTFVQSMEGVDFKGALKILADKAGVELVPEDPKKRSERDTGHVILNEATAFFEEKRRDNKDAESYLEKRGVTGETIAKWRIGYAPGPPHSGWRELRTHLKEKGFTDEQLLKTGLIKPAGEGKEPYDVFRDRVMFPIFDASGKVIAFSGRILSKDSDAPKYVNSPETEFFNKSEALYGYDKAKQGIRHYDFALIVEGQFDVVLSHQAGYANTVAVSGTALTPYHVGLLQRLTNRVVLALDADRAGIAAVKRAAELMLSRGIDLKVARIPEGEDPADIVKEDPKKFKDIIGHATHVIEFLLAILKEEAKDERTYKLRVREEVLPYIVRIDNNIDAEHFEQVAANAVNSSVEAIHLEVARLREAGAHAPEARPLSEEMAAKSEEKDTRRKDELLAYLAVATQVTSASISDALQKALKGVTGKSTDDTLASIPAAKQSELLFSLESFFETLTEHQIKSEIDVRMRELILSAKRDEIAEVKEKLYIAEQSGDETNVATCLSEVTRLQKDLAESTNKASIFSD